MLTTSSNATALKDLLIKHEGLRLHPYTDTTGHVTIGVGRNLSDRGILYSEAMEMLATDIDYFTQKLDEALPFFPMLDDARQVVLVNMCFNLGLKGLLGFTNMLHSVEKKDWINASSEILKSKAASQAPERYKDLARIMRTGMIMTRTN